MVQPRNLKPRILRFCLLALAGGGGYAVPFLSHNPIGLDWAIFWTVAVVCALAVGGSEFLQSDRWETPRILWRIVLSVVAMVVAVVLGGIVIRACGLHFRMGSSYPYAVARLGILLGMFALAIGIVRLGLWQLSRPIENSEEAQS